MNWTHDMGRCANAAYRMRTPDLTRWTMLARVRHIERDPKNYYQWPVPKPMTLVQQFNWNHLLLKLAPHIDNKIVLIQEYDDEVSMFVQIFYDKGKEHITRAFAEFHKFQASTQLSVYGVSPDREREFYTAWSAALHTYFDQYQAALSESFYLGTNWKVQLENQIRWSYSSQIAQHFHEAFPVDFLTRIARGTFRARRQSVAGSDDSAVSSSASPFGSVEVRVDAGGRLTWRIKE